MSFRTSYTDVVIVNRALGALGETAINSMDQGGPTAQKVRDHYKPVVRGLLEAHHFGLATKTAPMVSTPATRYGWAYEYLAPQDLAYAVAVVNTTTVELDKVSYFEGLRRLAGRPANPFMVEAGVVRSNLRGASLVYTSLDINESDFNELFVRVLVLRLAAALAFPITKRQDLRDEYEAKANTELNRVLAMEMNRQGQTYGFHITETELAREGWLY